MLERRHVRFGRLCSGGRRHSNKGFAGKPASTHVARARIGNREITIPPKALANPEQRPHTTPHVSSRLAAATISQAKCGRTKPASAQQVP